MSDDRPRFTLTMILQDNHSYDKPLSYAVGVDQELRISLRAIDEMKAGVSNMDQTVRMMRTREFRKALFIQAAERLGTLLAERMEDAEGWHDTGRIEPARRQLGGDWEFH
jgi:hypothetical protein